MEFKVGDKVKIREDLKIGTGRKECSVVESMLKYAGLTTEITGMDEDGDYLLSCDRNYYLWTEEMFELSEAPRNLAPKNKSITYSSMRFVFNGPATVCIIENEWGKFKGVAKCHPTDTWNEQTGKLWAQVRATEASLEATKKFLRGE